MRCLLCGFDWGFVMAGGRAAGAFGEMAEVAKNSAQEASVETKKDGEAEKTIDENEVDLKPGTLPRNREQARTHARTRTCVLFLLASVCLYIYLYVWIFWFCLV